MTKYAPKVIIDVAMGSSAVETAPFRIATSQNKGHGR
jgi:hypothetical protein